MHTHFHVVVSCFCFFLASRTNVRVLVLADGFFYPLLEVVVAIVVPLNDNSGVSEWSSQLHLPLCAISPIVPANCRVCFSSPPLVSTHELISFLHCSV